MTRIINLLKNESLVPVNDDKKPGKLIYKGRQCNFYEQWAILNMVAAI